MDIRDICIRDILRMAAEMEDVYNKAMEKSEKRRGAIVEAVRGGAGREELRKFLNEHYKKVGESINIETNKKAIKKAMKDSDTATDSAFTQAITALKEADEKMDELSKELQIDFICDMSETELDTGEILAMLGFVQASCEYSEFMFGCIYEALTERIEKLRKENEKLAEKYERTTDNLDAVLKEREEEEKRMPECLGEYYNNSRQCNDVDCKRRTVCKVLSAKNEKEKVDEKEKRKRIVI